MNANVMLAIFSSLPNCLVCCFCWPCRDLTGACKIFLLHAIIKINKMHITAPETISTCMIITFPHSQRTLLIVHLLSIAKHVGQMNQKLDIYERCLHAADGVCLYAKYSIFTLMSYSSLYIHCPLKVWKHWQSVVLDDISINPYNFLVQIH